MKSQSKIHRLPLTNIGAGHSSEGGAVLLPLFMHSVQAGLPAEAHDNVDTLVNLNDYFTGGRPEDVEIFTVPDDSMKEAGIWKGSTIFVDSKGMQKNGKILLVSLNRELLIRRLSIVAEKVYLTTDSDSIPPVDITNKIDCTVLGVVTHAVHHM